VMSFWFPSGLTLYIFTNTVLSALHSLYMNKYDKKSLAIAAQIKKNAADAQVRAAKEKEAQEVKAAKAKAKPAGNKSAQKVLDVSTDAEAPASATSDDSDDDRDDADSADDAPAIAASSSQARNRPRRKKRRR